MNEIRLGKVRIPIEDYAIQRNAILGIPESGKTVTATGIAEQLFDNGIPWVYFDPSGIARFLRVPGKSGKAYPVVVAGGENGDLPLTPESAPKIVRAAMQEGISLVIDFFDLHLSKADWKRIVTSCTELLLFENRNYGLRHIFLEEAKEFIPQRIGPEQGVVYAMIERVATMGGNSNLGMTIINQRAEEVNKAILELSNCVILHRQTGKNSIASLQKWLSLLDTEGRDEVIHSLAKLKSGECWVWQAGSEKPIRTQVQMKNTFHPDRRVRQVRANIKVAGIDVSDFVKRLSSSLEKQKGEKRVVEPVIRVSEIKETAHGLEQRIEELETALREANAKSELIAREANAKIEQLQIAILQATEILQSAGKVSSNTTTPHAASLVPMSKIKKLEQRVEENSRISKMGKKIFATLAAEYPDFPNGLTRAKLGMLTGYIVTAGSGFMAIKDLKERNLVTITGTGSEAIIAIHPELLK